MANVFHRRKTAQASGLAAYQSAFDTAYALHTTKLLTVWRNFTSIGG